MSQRDIEFDWDEANVGHVARHLVGQFEAEQVILNDPMDLGLEIVEGEERHLNLGATVQGRVLLVVTHGARTACALSPRSNQSSELFRCTTGNEAGDRLWPPRSN